MLADVGHAATCLGYYEEMKAMGAVNNGKDKIMRMVVSCAGIHVRIVATSNLSHIVGNLGEG